MEAIQDGRELLEILEADHLVFRDFLAPAACHSHMMRQQARGRKLRLSLNWIYQQNLSVALCGTVATSCSVTGES